jgi:hypothetical protein
VDGEEGESIALGFLILQGFLSKMELETTLIMTEGQKN